MCLESASGTEVNLHGSRDLKQCRGFPLPLTCSEPELPCRTNRESCRENHVPLTRCKNVMLESSRCSTAAPHIHRSRQVPLETSESLVNRLASARNMTSHLESKFSSKVLHPGPHPFAWLLPGRQRAWLQDHAANYPIFSVWVCIYAALKHSDPSNLGKKELI